jgi:hypothetical protein
MSRPSKKDVGAPNMSGLDELARLGQRFSDPVSTPPPAAVASESSPEARRRPQKTAMVRRSWYLPQEAAERLSEAVEELHYATRAPKHVVLAELVAAALEHLDGVQARLASPDDPAEARQRGRDDTR